MFVEKILKRFRLPQLCRFFWQPRGREGRDQSEEEDCEWRQGSADTCRAGRLEGEDRE